MLKTSKVFMTLTKLFLFRYSFITSVLSDFLINKNVYYITWKNKLGYTDQNK